MTEKTRKLIIVTLLYLGCLITLGCATVYNPVTQKEELTLINTPTERALGASVAQQIELEYSLVGDPEILSRVRRIGNSIAVQSGRRDIHYYFRVIDSDKINAIAIPGGYIYLFRKLVEKANDDELACVIGHEIAHVEARHGVKRLQVVLGYRLLMNLAFKREEYNDIVRYSNTIFNLISMGYSRQDELEADRVGVRYAYQAGYKPRAMISFLNKLKRLDEYSQYRIEFLSTHPLVEKRIENLEKEIKKLVVEK